MISGKYYSDMRSNNVTPIKKSVTIYKKTILSEIQLLNEEDKKNSQQMIIFN